MIAMSIRNIFLLYLMTLAAFLAIDLTWLGVIARDFYRSRLGHLMSERTIWPAAILFYLLFVLGLVFFAVLPGLRAGMYWRTLMLGALFGFFTYMTYDLTNLATLREWPLLLTVIDIVWGVVLAAATSSAGYWLGRWLLMP